MKRLVARTLEAAVRSFPFSALDPLAANPVTAPCYHMVSDETVPHVRHLYRYRTVPEFRTDLEFILKHYVPVSLHDLDGAVTQGRRLPAKALFLSFDDGFREMAEIVAPICRALGVPATCFVSTGLLDNRTLGFRQKASLLVDRCAGMDDTEYHARMSEVFRRFELPTAGGSPKQFFLSVKYAERGILDAAAERLDVDFASYLRAAQPYLSSQQVRNLARQGFGIGGHSVDHPLYSDLNLSGQLEQTRACISEIESITGGRCGSFAFPFVSDGVPRTFYDAVFASNLVDLVFCIGQDLSGATNRTIQRFGVEDSRGTSLESHLREQAGQELKRRILTRAGGIRRQTRALTIKL